MSVACLFPIKGYRDRDGKVLFRRPRGVDVELSEVRCGQCVHCRRDTAQRRGVRIHDEVKTSGGQAIMVTVTYDDKSLPPDGGLRSLDLKRFHWRLNEHFGGGLRYASCGEYGDVRLRPHYHVILANRVFNDVRPVGKSRSGYPVYESAKLNKLWPSGLVRVSEFHVDVAMYCAGYALKKIGGPASEEHYSRVDQDGEVHVVSREFFRQSTNMGRQFFDRFFEETYVHDCRLVNGKRIGVPRRYDEWLKLKNADLFEAVKERRVALGAASVELHKEDRTAERRKVLERIALMDRDRFLRDV